jgi:cytidylate kinase
MPINICLSGLSASGKTSVGKQLASRYDAEYISASQTLLAIAYPDDKGEAQNVQHYWLREEGRRLLERRFMDFSTDKAVDEFMRNQIDRTRNRVIDSLTTPLLALPNPAIFSVLLKASLRVRAQRAWSSDQAMSKTFVMRGLKHKDETTRKILLSLWNIDIARPSHDSYQLILNTSKIANYVDTPSPTSEIAAVVQIISSFSDIHKMLTEQPICKTDIKHSIDICTQVFSRYRPLLKKWPHTYLSVNSLMQSGQLQGCQ